VLVIGVMTLFGLAFSLRPAPKPIVRTESWLLDVTPREVDGYEAEPGPNGDRQTYRTTPEAYRNIDAFGIASFKFSNGTHELDVNVIASNKRESFHDPTQCLPGSGWTVEDRVTIPVSSVSRGSIPFSLMRTHGPGGPTVMALYTYKGPRGFVPTMDRSYMLWSIDQFLTGQPREGAFYRFIGDATTKEAELVRFVADYMDAIAKSSSGVL
jgi:hypothetical protein